MFELLVQLELLVQRVASARRSVQTSSRGLQYNPPRSIVSIIASRSLSTLVLWGGRRKAMHMLLSAPHPTLFHAIPDVSFSIYIFVRLTDAVSVLIALLFPLCLYFSPF